MSEIKIAVAQDGSSYPFVDDGAPVSGAMKDIYFSEDKSYAVAFYRQTPNETQLERLEKITGPYRKAIFETCSADESEYWSKLFCWPEKIVTCEGNVGYVMPVFPQDFFFSEGNLSGVEKKSNWFAAPRHFNRAPYGLEERGTLEDYLFVAWKLAIALRRLHASGCAHSDLSYNNCLVSPKHRRAYFIDLDGLVVNGLYPPDVVGSPDFTAPEVLATQHLPIRDPNRKLPNETADRHAFAVLIYHLLFHRHPLDGGQFFSEDTNEQVRLQMGENALFIEHPTDARNRVVEFPDKNQPWCDPGKIPYTLAGPYLKKLFDRAFIDALHQPGRRPGATEWEIALLRTFDLFLPCSGDDCPCKGFIFDPTTPDGPTSCPYCGTPYVAPIPVLDFYSAVGSSEYLSEKRSVVAKPDGSLYLWHLDTSKMPNERLTDDECAPVAYFDFHNGRIRLYNYALSELRNLSTDEPISMGANSSYVELRNGQELYLGRGCNNYRIKVKVRLANR